MTNILTLVKLPDEIKNFVKNNFNETLGSYKWLSENKQRILNIFPETWTHQANINPLKILFQFKLIGIDWRSEDDAIKILVFLEKLKFIVRDNILIKRGHKPLEF